MQRTPGFAVFHSLEIVLGLVSVKSYERMKSQLTSIFTGGTRRQVLD